MGCCLLTVPGAYGAAGNALYSSGAIAAIWVLFACLALSGLYLTYVGWREPLRPGSPGVPRVVKHPDVRRAELLERARAVYPAGCENVSLNDLIADAGVSKGAFYHWFPSKDALIAALAERSAREAFAGVEDALAACEGDALDRLNAVLQAGFDITMDTGGPEQLAAMAALLRPTMRVCTAETSPSRKRSPALADPADIGRGHRGNLRHVRSRRRRRHDLRSRRPHELEHRGCVGCPQRACP